MVENPWGNPGGKRIKMKTIKYHRCASLWHAHSVQLKSQSAIFFARFSADSRKRIKTVVRTRIYRCVLDDEENACFWKPTESKLQWISKRSCSESGDWQFWNESHAPTSCSQELCTDHVEKSCRLDSNKLTSKLQRTANEYAAKRRIYERPDQQKYTLSGHTEFCKADRTTSKLTLLDINTTPKEPKREGGRCRRQLYVSPFWGLVF